MYSWTSSLEDLKKEKICDIQPNVLIYNFSFSYIGHKPKLKSPMYSWTSSLEDLKKETICDIQPNVLIYIFSFSNIGHKPQLDIPMYFILPILF